MSIWDVIRTVPQFIAPHHGLSKLAGWLARSERLWLARALKAAFLHRYAADMTEAAEPESSRYASLNALFTRALKPGARPLPSDANLLISPSDGVLAEFGSLQHDRLVQAKGHEYSVNTLLANDTARSGLYHDGEFATIYLAPHHYHRVHAPCNGQLQQVVYIPGALFSVNPRTVNVVPGVFARNERVILHCSGEYGPFSLIMVGAMLVGSMELQACDLSALAASRRISQVEFERPVKFERGAELGRFNMGSTVIVLFGRQVLRWQSGLKRGSELRMGTGLAKPAMEVAS